jgi:hypothetical protein
MGYAAKLDTMASDVYRYLNFDQIAEFRKIAASANIPADITFKAKLTGKEPVTLKIQSNKSYAYVWVQGFCEWFEISSTTLLLKPQIKKVEVYGATHEQLANYSNDIEEVYSLKRTIEDFKTESQEEHASLKKLISETKTSQQALQLEIEELEEQQETLKIENEEAKSELEVHKKNLQQITVELNHAEKN